MSSSVGSRRAAQQPLKRCRTAGSGCWWPRAVEDFFGISACTRWRWERERRLPPRDVFLDGRAIGWKPETIQAAARGAASAAA